MQSITLSNVPRLAVLLDLDYNSSNVAYQFLFLCYRLQRLYIFQHTVKLWYVFVQYMFATDIFMPRSLKIMIFLNHHLGFIYSWHKSFFLILRRRHCAICLVFVTFLKNFRIVVLVFWFGKQFWADIF